MASKQDSLALSKADQEESPGPGGKSGLDSNVPDSESCDCQMVWKSPEFEQLETFVNTELNRICGSDNTQTSPKKALHTSPCHQLAATLGQNINHENKVAGPSDQWNLANTHRAENKRKHEEMMAKKKSGKAEPDCADNVAGAELIAADNCLKKPGEFEQSNTQTRCEQF